MRRRDDGFQAKCTNDYGESTDWYELEAMGWGCPACENLVDVGQQTMLLNILTYLQVLYYRLS